MRALTLALVAGLWVGGCDNGDGKDADSSTNPGTDIDADGDGYNADEDCNDEDDSINPNAVEACDGIDNDCDSDIDEAGSTGGGEFFADADGDGYGDAATSTTACIAPPDYIADSADCDDGNPAVNPGADEVCDGADNDCDNLTDDEDTDAVLSTFYPDVDGDGYGEEGGTPLQACELPDDYAAEPVDCDDSSADVYPGGTEVCDGLDNDCDGTPDDGFSTTTYYMDVDGDGYGDDATVTTACTALPGYVDVGGDCDDTVAASYPGAPETCDTFDNDCDGAVDDGLAVIDFYFDADGDGFGDPATMGTSCTVPGGYITDGTDCNDSNNAVNPLAIETCDAVDNDCNGTVDDGVSYSNYYVDTDGDGYGDDATFVLACVAPAGSVLDGGDCDETDAGINPGADEVCDAADVDEDCNGLADDDDAGTTDLTTYYIDMDADGSGDDSTMVMSCDPVSGYVDNANDPFEDAVMEPLLDGLLYEEVTDVVNYGDVVYVVGVLPSGDVQVAAVDFASGSAAFLFTGEPLVQPSGITISADGNTLYVSDVGAEVAGGSTSGGVYEIPVGGGSATEIGVAGVIDMPGDVTLGFATGTLLVTGLGTSGAAGVWEVDVATGGATVLASGAPLVDPLAVAVDADTGAFYVLDSFAADGDSALLAFDAAGNFTDELAYGFVFGFPGGVALDAGRAKAFYSTTSSTSGVVAVSTDGSGDTESLATPDIGLAGGLTFRGEALVVTDLSASATYNLSILYY